MYIMTIVGTLAALVIMVIYNYFIFYSNSTVNMEDIGVSSLSQVTEQLEGYLSKGMNVVQTTAVTLEYMMENDASAEEIEKFLVYESYKYDPCSLYRYTGIFDWSLFHYVSGRILYQCTFHASYCTIRRTCCR